MSDQIAFDSTANAALRRLRKNARRDGRPEIMGYVAPDGTKLALTGDEEAPYVKVINSASAPVQVTIAGSSSTQQVVGNVAHDAVDSGNPVKVGARAATSLLGISQVAADDRTDLAANLRGQLQVALAGAGEWSKFNSDLATPATSFAVSAVPCILGRLSLTADEANAMYALVYDGVDATGTLVERFYIPASGSSVRDYTTEGGLNMGTGCFVALTTDAGAVTAPATGCFCHAITQAT